MDKRPLLIAALCAVGLCVAAGIILLPQPPDGEVASDATPIPTEQIAPTLAPLLETPSDEPHQLLVIGWDGADWELLDPMLADGRLPNLASLIDRGAAADLWSLKPMISPLIWTSVATGYLPDVHGVLDFVHPHPEDGHPVPVTSADRKVPALWNVLSEAGLSVAVSAWWATWPAERVNGVIVSDRVSYQLGDFDGRPQNGLVYPPDAWDWLRAEAVIEEAVGFESIARFVHISQDEFNRVIGDGGGFEDPVIHLRRLLASTHSYHRMTLAALKRIQPRVLFAYVEGTDTIAHLFAPYAPPRRPEIDTGDYARFQDAVGEFYEMADELLGELLAEAGPSANVIVCSDHGFTWGDDRPREASGTNTPTAAWWHRDPGILVVAGPDFRSIEDRQEAKILDLPPTILTLTGLPGGQGMPGTVPEWALVDGFSGHTRDEVDYAQLMAWEPGTLVTDADPGDAEVVEKLRALGYLGEAEPAAESPAAESERELLNLGTMLLEQGRPEEALAAYRNALELNPASPGAWLKCAVAQHRLGLFEEALASNRKVIELGGNGVHRESASLGMAIALVELGRPGEAMMLLEAATTQLADSFILWKTRGDIALGQGAGEIALHAYSTALEIQDDTDALNRLAALVLQIRGDAAGAEVLWRRSLRRDPDQPRVVDALRALGADPQ